MYLKRNPKPKAISPYQWHPYFAWWPVTVEWGVCWLEVVERRQTQFGSWQYRRKHVRNLDQNQR